jgi:fucose permease
VAGPFAVQAALHQGIGWRPALWVAAAMPLAVLATLWPRRIAPGRTAPAEARDGLLRQPALWLCGLILLLYVGVEMSVGVWLPTYWARRAAGSAVPAPLLGAIFWGSLTAGRFVAGWVADRMGHLRFLAVAAGAVIVLGGVWSMTSGPAFTIFAAVAIGAVLAGIYPTAMAYATDRFPGHSGTVVAFLSVFVAVGGFLMPSGLGRLSDAFGIGVLPVVVAGLGLVLLTAILGVRAPRPSPEVTPGSP